MASSRRARLGRVLLRCLLIAVGAVVAMSAFGFAVGGWAGARGGAFWGLAAALLAVPGMLLGLVLASTEDTSEQIVQDWGERRYGSGREG
jgi:hypothetical protein